VKTHVSITDQDRRVTRGYGLQVVRNRSLTTLLLTAAMAGAIRSVGPPSEGTTRVTFSLDADGLPHLTRQNTYAVGEGGGLLALLLGPSAAVASATEELSQILDGLQNSEFGEAKLTQLGISVEISKRRRVARLERVVVNKHKVKPGEEVEVTTALRAANTGPLTRVDTIRIPENCPPGRVQIGIAGGRSAEWMRSRLEISEPRPESLTQMVQQMLQRPSNDQIVVQVALPTVGIEARGQQLRDLPPAVMDVLRSSSGTKLRPLRDYVEKRTGTEWMVSGYSVVSLIVEGDERDKGGRPPSPQYGGSMFEEMPAGLMGIFSGFGLSSHPTAAGGDTGGESDFLSDDEVAMPSWEEVGSVGESELMAPLAVGEPSAMTGPKGDAIGRLASVWQLSTEKDFSQGKAEGVAVLSTGGLTLAPKPTVLGRISAQCIWPIAVGPDGSVYTGSWADGKLWRTTHDGKTAVLLETKDAAIQALSIASDGTVYAAAMPSGAIYQMKPGSKPALLATLPAPDIWALSPAPGGDLWAATGPEGKLFRIHPDGKYTVAFAAADRHIIALATGADGTVYLATSPRGKVYAILPDGTARSVFEVEKSSAQSVAADSAGNVYIGTSPDGRVLRIDKAGAMRELLKTKGRHVTALQVSGDGVVYAAVGPEAAVYAIYPDLS
jgi:sugar lactone lactonase YvrE